MNKKDPRYNKEQRDRVRELHNKRWSVRAIAAELGVSSTRVQAIKNELRLGAHPRKKLAKMHPTEKRAA